MHGYIYITENLINGKRYIGQHKAEKVDNFYMGSGKIIKLAIDKYGRDKFKTKVLEWCINREELNVREIYWIDYFNAVRDGMFYNIGLGGEGFCLGKVGDIGYDDWKYKHDRSCRTKEYREKISKISKERWSRRNFKEKETNRIRLMCSSKEYRERRSEITRTLWGREEYRDAQMCKRESSEFLEGMRTLSKNKWTDEEYRNKQIKSRNNPKYLEEMRRKQKESHNTDKCKEKQSDSAKKLWKREGFREKHNVPVKCVELDKSFESVKCAQEWIYLSGLRGSLGVCLRGGCKTAGGYHWEYDEVYAGRD